MEQKRRDVGGKLKINGKIYTIYRGVNPVGRNKEAVVNIKSLGVSQQHAILILVDDDSHFISDLNSSNGTFVDNIKVNPFQLYRLKDGASIKFANIEGIYNKFSSQDIEHQGNNSNLSESTQNFTQNFYGSDTQMIDNTINITNTRNTSPESNYIPSQMLAEMAEKLEESYIEVLESATQVVNTQDRIKWLETRQSKINSNEDVHEAETQIVVAETVVQSPVNLNADEVGDTAPDDHDAKTQEVSYKSNEETLLRSIIDMHEIEADNDMTQDYTQSARAGFTQDIENELKNIETDVLTENTQNSPNDEGLKEAILKVDTSGAINSDACLSQEEEVIRPLGLSRSILNDSTNSSCGEADIEITKPTEKCINSLQTDDSAFDGMERNAEQIEICQKEKGESKYALSDKEQNCEGSTSGGNNEESNKTQENPTESSDDSECVIRSAKKPWNLFESQESTDLEEDSNDSVDFMTMQKIPSTQKYFNSEVSPSDEKSADVSETGIKISETSKTTNSSLEEVHYSDSETDIEENVSNVSRKNRMKNTEKISEIIETPDKVPQVAASICDESDTDIDDNEIPSNKNESIGLILEDSALDETLDSSRKIENNVDLLVRNPHNAITSSNVHKEDLDDSDFIPTTQEEHSKPISQNSKYESSENSFKLGLTQLMEEEGTTQINTQDQPKENNGPEQKESQNESQSSTNNQKKFTFRKSLVGTTKSGDVTLELDEDIYQAATQNIYENTQKIDHPIDDQGFLKPTQEAPKKEKQNKTKNLQDDDIYILSTQKLDENSTQKLDKSSTKISDDDVYLQSTQKLIPDEHQKKSFEPKNTRLSDDFYQSPTQRIPQEKNKELPEISIAHENIEECDIFATQAMVSESPTKCLESELDHMFATQRVLPADDTLNKIKDIVCEKGISDDKLPSEDKDLEAILCTQKMLDSPKSPANKKSEEIQQKSVESQLEVIFASQSCNLVQDKFIRPANPLINVLGADSQNLPSNVENVSSDKSKTINENENTSIIKSKQKNQNGLEQSFALLEANSTKIRRSVRNKNLEEITVSCPKSEVSMTLVPNNKVKREEVIPSRNMRLSRKRQPPTALDNFVTDVKETRRSKRRRHSEDTDEDNCSDISSKKNDHSKILNKIPEHKEVEAQRPEDKKRSSRMQKKTQSNVNREDVSSVSIELNSSKSENENIKNKHLAKIQEDEQIFETSKRPETPSRPQTSRMEKKVAQDKERVENGESDEKKDRSTRENIKNDVSSKKRIKDVSEQPETPCRKRGSRMHKDAQNKQISEYEDLNLKKTRNKTKFSEALGTNNNDHKADVSKESDEASVDSRIEDSFKKRKTKQEEIKTCKPGSSKLNKNKNSNSTEKDIEEQPTEAPTKSKRRRDETNEEVTNNRNKSRHNLETPATPSRSTKRGCTTEVTIAQKIRKVSDETPSSGRNEIDSFGTPNRIKRKLKPKVVFTMMDNPRIESQIKLMGGSIVDSVDACTVLLTQSVKRSMKLLSAVGLGKPICSENWVLHSKQENNFLDPWDYILKDKEAEKKWDFSLKTSLERSSMSKLFEGYTFQLLVSNALDVLKGAIESCGGKIVTKTPKGVTNFIIVASTDQKDKYKKLLKQKPDLIIVEPEAIFDGVLRQEIRFERHLLK